MPLLLLGLLHCKTGGPSDAEKTAFALLGKYLLKAALGPRPTTNPEPSSGAAPNGATNDVLATTQSTSAIVVPFAEREADCSLTETFVDETQQVVVRRSPDLQLRLHTLSGLATTPGVFPQGCSDAVLGVASATSVVAGRRANGEYFGATSSLDEDGILRILQSQNRSALAVLKTVVVRPAGSAYEIESLATADLDGDQINDLVVALGDFSVANGTGKVAVLKGRGKGKFAAPVYLALPFPARGVTIADLTKDGLPDIAAVGQSPSGSGVASFKNLGNGSFAAAVLAPQGAHGSRLIAADFDGDLKVDLATSDGQWLRGKGNGTFEAPADTGWSGRTLASGDFDGNGVLDVAVGGADSGTQVAIYRGLGGGAFARGEVYAGTLDPSSIAVSEIDGDGNVDLVIGLASGGLYGSSDGSGGVTSYLLGRGDGTFAGVPVRDGVIAAVADFDGDHVKDLLTAEDGSGTRFRLFRGKKKFHFKAPVVFDESFPTVDLAVGKLDANDSPDFVALARGTSVSDPGTLHVRLRQGKTFVPGDDLTLGFKPTIGATRSLALGDFDGDGDLDLAVIGSLTTSGLERPGVLVVYRGAGNGTFGSPTTVASNLLNPIALVAASRTTSGGNIDLVLIERGDPFVDPTKPGSTRIYAGKGDGTFVTPPIVLDGVANPDALAVADVNGDGLRDVLVAGPDASHDNSLQVSLRRASGRFAPAKVKQLVQFATTGIAVADLDLDGKPDAVLTGCCGVAFTSLMLGNGNGKFDVEAFLPVEIAGSRPELVDLDRDGRPDLVLSSQDRAGIALLRNMHIAP